MEEKDDILILRRYKGKSSRDPDRIIQVSSENNELRILVDKKIGQHIMRIEMDWIEWEEIIRDADELKEKILMMRNGLNDT